MTEGEEGVLEGGRRRTRLRSREDSKPMGAVVWLRISNGATREMESEVADAAAAIPYAPDTDSEKAAPPASVVVVLLVLLLLAAAPAWTCRCSSTRCPR